MIKNYFKIAWRNLVNRKFYSAINIVGLTVGLAVGLLILLWVKDELSYDRFNSKAAQIYQVNGEVGSGSTKQIWGVSPGPVAAYALKEVPGVLNAVRIITNYNYSIFNYQDKNLKQDYGSLSFVDDSFFKIFDYHLLKGNLNKPFPDAASVIITESTAKRFFGDADPIGKVLKADSKTPFVVSGILADFPANSSIHADMLFSINLRKKEYANNPYHQMDNDWGNFYAKTYLLVSPNASISAIERKLTQIHRTNYAGMKPTEGAFDLQPLADIHLYNPDGTSAGIQIVKIFAIVALLILLIACINYVNLSTALAILRSKEVSIRKVVGAERKHLFMQFVIETILCFSIALLLALATIYAVMPLYNSLSGKNMQFNLLNADVWKVIGLTITTTLIAASVYPALLLSSFEPINALKGKVSGAGNATFRKVLVVCQFAFSIGLIIGTIVINKQLNFINRMDTGYNKEHIFSVQLRSMQDHYEAVKAELLQQPSITGVTSGNGSVVTSAGSTTGTDWDGKDPSLSLLIYSFNMDQDFMKVMKLKLASGEGFTGSKADTANFILNETAVKLASIKNPVGKRFKIYNVNGKIIGVVKDFHFASAKQPIEPSIFLYRKSSWQMLVKTTGKDAPAAIAAVAKLWKKYNAGFPFEYHFLDDDYNYLYKSETQTAKLFNVFACIAIFISCLGLFGLATYTAQVKVKEIGIRKVLGASVANITAMLSKDFLLLVILAFAIASPAAWYFMNKWLMAYAYRTSLPWWVIGLAGFTAVVIAFITISFQSIKAALANPVKSLRNE
ncbi:ABC transporter permease [Mucilaginibacter ximonensis]|uniref:ABC transporter permease n=1 Tax=Mucilaginibacter ximonensis TaxID=538021 RepID=A0ABW5YCG5_9SPHI